MNRFDSACNIHFLLYNVSMDPITHGLTGAVISRLGFYQRFGRAATIIFITAALIPDIDHFSLRLAGPLAYLKYHRGFTHSIAGSFIIAAAIAGIASFLRPAIRAVGERMGWPVAFAFSLLGIYSHIFLDLITSYGTQVFFPFSRERYSLDLVFIIDFYFTSLLLISLIIMRFKKGWSKILAVSSLAGIAIYLGFAYMEKAISIDKVRTENNKHNITGTRIEAIPLPLSPFRWSVYTEDRERFHQTNMDNLSGNSTVDVFQKKINGNDITDKIEALDIVQTYLWFARFPIESVKQEDGGYLVEYFDIRFNSLPHRKPFLLRLFLDKNGSLKHADLNFHAITEK